MSERSDQLPQLGPGYLDDIAALCARGIVGAPTIDELEGALFNDEQPAVVRGDPAVGIVATVTADNGGHIRLLVVDPGHRGKGHGHALVKAAESDARDAGHDALSTGADAPYFLWPGIPSTDTSMICLFEHHHYFRAETNFDMTVDLSGIPDDPGGHVRASPADADELETWMTTHWANWRAEVMRALGKGNLVLVRGEDGIRAFCAFEVNRSGFLGPVGVRPDLMGQGVGRPAPGPHAHRRVLGGSCDSVCARRWARHQLVFRVPPEAEMNLLPRPRFIDCSDVRVPNAAPRERIDPSLPAEGYELHIGADGVDLAAGDDAGLFYARHTLAQLARIHDGSLPVGVIRDHPDLPVRGVMLDISRDKVPSMATLHDLIDRLASWKINQVQLYSEHTFAYRNHEIVHEHASPLSADEIIELDAFCRERFVELVPNQNCLGHMNRWVEHEPYRALALAPDGFADPWGMFRNAMTLDPTNPGSLELIRELLAELLPLFTSKRVHVGLDEAWELPRERMDEFMAWIDTLRALPELAGREMLIWGDMIAGDIDRLRQLPPGVTVCEWGYDDWHPFDERVSMLADAGVPFWVAPGTSSWLSIVGRVPNMIGNCQLAARAALAHGGLGYLNTDWGDQGHLQQYPISDPGFAYGAAVSWCLDTNADIDLAAAMSAHCYDDPSGNLAAAVLALGRTYLDITSQFPNMATIVLHLYFPQLTVGRGLTRGITVDQLDRLAEHLAEARALAPTATSARADAKQLTRELEWSADLVTLTTDDARARLQGDGTLGSVDDGTRKKLAARLAELTAEHRALWLARNRPGGLDDSVAWLDNLYAAYTSGQPDPNWGGWRVRDRSSPH